MGDVMNSGKNKLDGNGWLGAKWGMTEPDVLAALSDYPVRSTEREQFDGHYSKHVLDGIRIGAYPFEAKIQLKNEDGTLGRVVMRHSLPPGEPQDDVVKAVFNALSEDFGTPVMMDRSTHFMWTLPSTKIQLHTINLPNSLNLVSVIFSPATAS
jgi:hypothetical protein